MSHRQLSLEREVCLDSVDPSISSLFLDRGWASVITGLIAPSLVLIQEFYSNIHAITYDSFCTFVRGARFHITADILARLIGIPRVANPLYPYSSALTRPSFNEIATFLHGAPLEWNGKAFRTSYLSSRRLVVSRIMLTNLFPASHFSSLSEEKALFLYALLSGQPIDLPSHFITHIVANFSGRKEANLPFGCLIQRLLAGLGHPFADYPRLPLSRPITSTTFAQSRSHARRFAIDPEELFDEPLPAVPPPQPDEGPSGSASSCPDPSAPGPSTSHRHSTSSSAALMGQMSRLADRFERLYSSQERILASQSQYQSQLLARFDRVDTRLDTQEAAYQRWQRHYGTPPSDSE